MVIFYILFIQYFYLFGHIWLHKHSIIRCLSVERNCKTLARDWIVLYVFPLYWKTISLICSVGGKAPQRAALSCHAWSVSLLESGWASIAVCSILLIISVVCSLLFKTCWAWSNMVERNLISHEILLSRATLAWCLARKCALVLTLYFLWIVITNCPVLLVVVAAEAGILLQVELIYNQNKF